MTAAPVVVGTLPNLCNFADGTNSGTFEPTTGDYSFEFTDYLTYPPGVYTFTITASVGTGPTETTQVTFDMTLVGQCEPPNSIVPQATLPNIEYVVGTAQLLGTILPFTVDPSFCLIGYTYSISPATAGIYSVIVFDPILLTIAIETSDLAYAGADYTVTISALSPDGIDTGSGFSFDVKITDPCDTIASLTADPSNTTEESYTITDNPFVFAAPKVISDDPGCVLSYTFDVANPTVKAALTFTNDPTSPEFSLTYATDLSVVGIHEVSVIATTGTLGLS